MTGGTWSSRPAVPRKVRNNCIPAFSKVRCFLPPWLPPSHCLGLLELLPLVRSRAEFKCGLLGDKCISLAETEITPWASVLWRKCSKTCPVTSCLEWCIGLPNSSLASSQSSFPEQPQWSCERKFRAFYCSAPNNAMTFQCGTDTQALSMVCACLSPFTLPSSVSTTGFPCCLHILEVQATSGPLHLVALLQEIFSSSAWLCLLFLKVF